MVFHSVYSFTTASTQYSCVPRNLPLVFESSNTFLTYTWLQTGQQHSSSFPHSWPHLVTESGLNLWHHEDMAFLGTDHLCSRLDSVDAVLLHPLLHPPYYSHPTLQWDVCRFLTGAQMLAVRPVSNCPHLTSSYLWRLTPLFASESPLQACKCVGFASV